MPTLDSFCVEELSTLSADQWQTASKLIDHNNPDALIDFSYATHTATDKSMQLLYMHVRQSIT